MAVTWTEEQKKVITLRDRNILVSAAAGSGKTAVLVQRILSKIMDPDRPVDIDRLLIMTFTRAAAGEMKERISAAIEQTLYDEPDNEHLQRQMTLIHNAQITTIDGFCAWIIRNYFHMIGLDPGYRIAEEGELKLLKEDVMKDLLEEAYSEADEKFISLVECYATGKNDDNIRDMVLKLYDSAMSQPFPEEWLEKCMEVYRCETLEELEKGEWMSLLWDAVEEKIQQAEILIHRALEICDSPEGPYLYRDAMESDALFCQEIRKAAEERDYNGLKAVLDGHNYTKLSLKRDKNIDAAKKDMVKDLRAEEKEIWGELSEKYLSQTAEDMLALLHCCRKPLEGLVELTAKFAEAFTAKKREKNVLDFVDMEHLALEILVQKEEDTLEPTQAARELSQRYAEVMVDEYQDSNGVQELLTTMVSGWVDGRKNIFMVGDVKQSIYRFRMAMPELFMEKYHRYSLEDSKEQRIDLHKNFRSRKEVLSGVNYIFRQIMGEDLGGITYDDDNALYAGGSFPEGAREEFLTPEVLLIEKDGKELEEEKENRTAQELEALAIAHRIRQMVGKEKIVDKGTGEYRDVAFGDIVILLRTATGWSETFSEVLTEEGIPVYTASRTGYFSTQEVMTLLNYLRICDNPLQDIPMVAVLHSPIGGFTSQELAVIRSTVPGGYLYESLLAYLKEEQPVILNKEDEKIHLKEKIKSFLVQMERCRDLALFTPIHELISVILKESGYGSYIRAVPGGAQRSANLMMLVEKAMDYEKTSYRGLFNFVRYIEKLQKYEVDFGEVNLADAGSGAVQIMTIHKSKGLEFPVVFVAGMGKQFNFQDINARFLVHPQLGLGADAVLPDKRLIISTMYKHLIRRELKRECLGEELRVLYVALTRAKEKLIITGTIGKIEETMNRLVGSFGTEAELLSMGIRGNGRCFWDYILPALARHEAMRPLFLEYGITEKPYPVCRKEQAKFEIRKVTAADLIEEEILNQTEDQIQEDILKKWDPSVVYDQKIREELEKRFSFAYPYTYLKDLPVKVSVSELKKRSYAEEQEKEEAVFYEKETETLVPRFISEKTEEYKGAARGTAYHRVMECLDYTQIATETELREQISKLVKEKKMSQEEADCIRIRDLQKFTESSLGKRMKEASLSHNLHREQPFVISRDMKQIDISWKGKETVLVQGIIDAYFIEDNELVLVDYKTDRVYRGEEQKLKELYHSQLEDYSAALERMLNRKVKEKYIYSFSLGKALLL